VPFWVQSRLTELSHGSNSRLKLIQKEDLLKKRKRLGQESEKHLHKLLGRLSHIVDRVFLRLSFNRETFKLDNKLDRETKANHREQSTYNVNGIPPCPVCGVVPHNLAIHDEWRFLPGAKGADKIAAEREVTRNGDPRVAALDAAGSGILQGCGICGSAAIFDNWLDINLCPKCGAREVVGGWQER
jgi:hypothetical protein